MAETEYRNDRALLRPRNGLSTLPMPAARGEREHLEAVPPDPSSFFFLRTAFRVQARPRPRRSARVQEVSFEYDNRADSTERKRRSPARLLSPPSRRAKPCTQSLRRSLAKRNRPSLCSDGRAGQSAYKPAPTEGASPGNMQESSER